MLGCVSAIEKKTVSRFTVLEVIRWDFVDLGQAWE